MVDNKQLQVNTPNDLLQIAVANGVDIEQLKALMELQERYEDREAKKAYTKAMASFKANPPTILKDVLVEYGNTKYRHASLANITKTINAALGECGLSSGWSVNQEDGVIAVTCTITHELGHSDSTTMKSTPDTTGSKNSNQAIGSAVTYLSRYTLMAITGLAAGTDDDGAASATEEQPEKEEYQLPPVKKFLEALDWFADNKKTVADLDKWFAEKTGELSQLSDGDQVRVQNHLAEIKGLLAPAESKIVIDC